MTSVRQAFPTEIGRSLIIGAVLILGCPSAANAQQSDAGPMERRVQGQTLVSTSDVAVSMNVDDSFVYAGGRRFILRGHTDVEQHFFVEADIDGDVERMYWIQFEAKLPHNEDPYNYASTVRTTIGDFDFVTHVRRYDTEPVSDSDRGAAYRYLAEQGYRVPTPAIRCRLIHIPAGDGRQELMIIYLERNDATGDVSAAEQERLTARAVAGLSLAALR